MTVSRTIEFPDDADHVYVLYRLPLRTVRDQPRGASASSDADVATNSRPIRAIVPTPDWPDAPKSWPMQVWAEADVIAAVAESGALMRGIFRVWAEHAGQTLKVVDIALALGAEAVALRAALSGFSRRMGSRYHYERWFLDTRSVNGELHYRMRHAEAAIVLGALDQGAHA